MVPAQSKHYINVINDDKLAPVEGKSSRDLNSFHTSYQNEYLVLCLGLLLVWWGKGLFVF